MQIKLRSLGGIAGGQRPVLCIDPATLAPTDAAHLRKLVSAALRENAPRRTEGMRNSIDIEDRGRTVTLSPGIGEAGKFPAFLALLDWLSERA